MGELKKVPVVGVIVNPQSYLNIIYLLLGLPLGIAYFVFVVTGISVGSGLLVIWVGVPILAFVLLGSWGICQFERLLVNTLLKEEIPRIDRVDTSRQPESSLGAEERLFIGAWRRLKAHLSDRLTWTGILYLLLKGPIGTGSFVMAVVLISVTGSLLGAPAYYWVDQGIDFGIWQIDELWEAVILTIIGVPAVFVSLNLMNVTAFLSGKLARVMLGKMH